MLVDLKTNDEEAADWLRASLATANSVLVENGLPTHSEPETLPPFRSRAELVGYPYSFLHHLRRFAAHVSNQPDWTPQPFPESENPADDPVVADELSLFSSHLQCHSDCEGYYLPIDFAEPLFDDEERIPGGMLGSSYGLRRELAAVAPALGIKLDGEDLSDAEAGRINGLVDAEGPFWIELAVWISLFEAARLSIEHRTAIVFA